MTAPVRPEGTPDSDGVPVYVQPVDDVGLPLAQPRFLDSAFTRRMLHGELGQARRDSALAHALARARSTRLRTWSGGFALELWLVVSA